MVVVSCWEDTFYQQELGNLSGLIGRGMEPNTGQSYSEYNNSLLFLFNHLLCVTINKIFCTYCVNQMLKKSQFSTFQFQVVTLQSVEKFKVGDT